MDRSKRGKTRKGTKENLNSELALKGKAALRLDERSIEEFLKTATDEQLASFIDLF